MGFGAAADGRGGRGFRVLDLLEHGPRDVGESRLHIRLSGFHHGLGDPRPRCFDGSIADYSRLGGFGRAFLFCLGHGVGYDRARGGPQKRADDGFRAHLVLWLGFGRRLSDHHGRRCDVVHGDLCGSRRGPKITARNAFGDILLPVQYPWVIGVACGGSGRLQIFVAVHHFDRVAIEIEDGGAVITGFMVPYSRFSVDPTARL